jgi:IS30 family transposase
VLDLDADDVAGLPCAETIYRAVYDGTLDVIARECLRMRRPRRRSRTARNPSNRPALPNIIHRPAAVNDRTEAGHWEVDQIIGAHNRSSMIWLTERVTRYSIPITMPVGYAADAVLAGLVEACEQIPTHLLCSMSFDQRSGMSPVEWWGSRDAFPGGCQVPGWSSALTAGSVSRVVWSLAIEASEK